MVVAGILCKNGVYYSWGYMIFCVPLIDVSDTKFGARYCNCEKKINSSITIIIVAGVGEPNTIELSCNFSYNYHHYHHHHHHHHHHHYLSYVVQYICDAVIFRN